MHSPHTNPHLTAIAFLGGAPAIDYGALGALFRALLGRGRAGQRTIGAAVARERAVARKRIVSAVVLVVAGVLLPALPGHAASIAVAAGLADTGDDDACSLREAIANAEADRQVHADCLPGSGADVITLPAGTYDLDFPIRQAGDNDGSAFVITTDITVVGAGGVTRTGATILDAGGTRRHFVIEDTGALTLQDVHLQHGYQGSDSAGGALLNWGTLTVTGSTLSSNKAPDGSAITNVGTATITGSVLISNDGLNEHPGQVEHQPGFPHGLLDPVVSNTGVVNVIGSTVHGNAGTALYNYGGTAAISGSTISANTGPHAGAIFHDSNYICLIPLDGCQTPEEEHRLTIRNSTITGNTSMEANVAGGIDAPHFNAPVTLQNVTMVGNSSIQAQMHAVHADVSNTIITQPVGTNCRQTGKTHGEAPQWTGVNNLTDASCNASGFTQVDDVLLQPLADNGGPTLTHLPHPASLAVNAGSAQVCAGRSGTGGGSTDQRGAGFPRTVGAVCDIGAVEGDVPGFLGGLFSDVEHLRFRGAATNEGLRTSLLAKIVAAADSVDRGDYDAATGQLGAFNEQVEAYAGGPIMEADALRLTTGALVIIDLFPEGGIPPDDSSPLEDSR